MIMLFSCAARTQKKLSREARRTNEKDGAEMVLVNEGKLELGGTREQIDALKNELVKNLSIKLPDNFGDDFMKQGKIFFVSDFYIYLYPVTNKQFAKFINETGYKTTAEKNGYAYVYDGKEAKKLDGANWAHPAGEFSSIKDILNHPVVHVSFNDAHEYAKWAGCELPTEAQCEKAARGAGSFEYPWGNSYENGKMNTGLGKQPYIDNSDGFDFTNPVDAFKNGASSYGVHEMAGNVWEWTSDWYAADAYKNMEEKNPTGPSRGEMKVIRGGSWFSHPGMCKSFVREKMSPSRYNNETGFRCVLNIK